MSIDSELASAIWLPDCEAEYEELVLAVHRAVLARLPRPLREIVTRVLDDQSQVQIADELQVNQVTMLTAPPRARAILRGELSAHLLPCGSRPRAGAQRPEDIAT